MAGFSVDLGALERATEGVKATLDQIGGGSVRDYAATPADFGDDDLAATVADFSDRWQIGVRNLVKDAQAIAAQLTKCVAAYHRAEAANQQQFTGILRGSGPDPAGGT